jgi:hypothetical protein
VTYSTLKRKQRDALERHFEYCWATPFKYRVRDRDRVRDIDCMVTVTDDVLRYSSFRGRKSLPSPSCISIAVPLAVPLGGNPDAQSTACRLFPALPHPGHSRAFSRLTYSGWHSSNTDKVSVWRSSGKDWGRQRLSLSGPEMRHLTVPPIRIRTGEFPKFFWFVCAS